MVKVYQFLATGFEETEALAPVDILRRGSVDVRTVSITGTEYVESAHHVIVKADLLFEDADLSDAGCFKSECSSRCMRSRVESVQFGATCRRYLCRTDGFGQHRNLERQTSYVLSGL